MIFHVFPSLALICILPAVITFRAYIPQYVFLMPESSHQHVRLLISHNHHVEDVEARSLLQNLLASPDLSEIHNGWSLRSLDRVQGIEGDTHRQCIVSGPNTWFRYSCGLTALEQAHLKRPKCSNGIRPVDHVDSLCNALATLHFQTRLSEIFGHTAVNYSPHPDDGLSALEKIFAARFAFTTLTQYDANHWLTAQFVLHQAGFQGFIARNPSKWVKGL